MITLTISINARSNKRNELLSACRSIIDKTRTEKGCIGCRYYQDIGNGNLIYVEETWRHRSYLDKHFRSEIFSALLGAMKLLGETHEIQINDGYQTQGIETVQSARSKEGTSGS